MGIAISPVTFPDGDSGYGWDFDIGGITDLWTKELKLELPVTFRWSKTKQRLGTHYCRKIKGKVMHTIVIARNQSMDSANNIIWHEIRHALQTEEYARQSEECPTTFHSAYKAANGVWGVSYRENLYEIDAREFATANESSCLLVEV